MLKIFSALCAVGSVQQCVHSFHTDEKKKLAVWKQTPGGHVHQQREYVCMCVSSHFTQVNEWWDQHYCSPPWSLFLSLLISDVFMNVNEHRKSKCFFHTDKHERQKGREDESQIWTQSEHAGNSEHEAHSMMPNPLFLTLPSRPQVYSQRCGQMGANSRVCCSINWNTRSLCMPSMASSRYLSLAACIHT